MFLLSLLLLASLHAVAGFTMFASIPAFDGVHTVLAGPDDTVERCKHVKSRANTVYFKLGRLQ